MNPSDLRQQLQSVLKDYHQKKPAQIKSLVIIAGVSGAGRSSALRIIADLGYYVTDNLPTSLFPPFLKLLFSSNCKYDRIALTLDCSSEETVQDLVIAIEELRANSVPVALFFLTTASEKLLQRYSETRRPHPVYDPSYDKNLQATIERERLLLAPIKRMANLTIDSTPFTIHDLKRTLTTSIESLDGTPTKTYISLCSFGFKYGLPRECDMVLDVRFLTNPYFVEDLRKKTGLDAAVSSYVMKDPDAQQFEQRALDLLNYLLPRYMNEGKSRITIGIGCTGGKHRSVTLVESMAGKLSIERAQIVKSHRDIEK